MKDKGEKEEKDETTRKHCVDSEGRGVEIVKKKDIIYDDALLRSGPIVDECSKRIDKYRFKLPFNIVCKGCDCIIASGVKVNAIKELFGKLWHYNFACPFCGNNITVKRTSGFRQHRVVRGGTFDWDTWKKEPSRSILESTTRGLSDRYNLFDVFDFALFEVDPEDGKTFRKV